MSFVKLDRSIKTRSWYKDTNASRLYMHLLMSVDYQTNTMEIAQTELAVELGMSLQQLRTAFDKLESTGDVVKARYGRHTIIQVIDEQHPNNIQITENQHNEKPAIEPSVEDETTSKQHPNNIQTTFSNNIYKYIYINNNKRIREERNARTHVQGYDNIILTINEYNKLVNQYGKDMIDRALEQVSLYSKAKGITYADAGPAILRWGIKAVKEREERKPKIIQRDYSDDFLNSLIDN